MADARHVEFSPFCDDAQQALLDERFLFFLFATFISKKKKHTREDIPHEGRVAALFVLFALCCILGHGSTKSFALEAVSDCTCFFGGLFFWEHTRLLDDDDDDDNHDDDE